MHPLGAGFQHLVCTLQSSQQYAPYKCTIMHRCQLIKMCRFAPLGCNIVTPGRHPMGLFAPLGCKIPTLNLHPRKRVHICTLKVQHSNTWYDPSRVQNCTPDVGCRLISTLQVCCWCDKALHPIMCRFEPLFLIMLEACLLIASLLISWTFQVKGYPINSVTIRSDCKTNI